MPSQLRSAVLLSLTLCATTAPLTAQGAVTERTLDLFPGGYLDLESGVVLNVESFGALRADLKLVGLALPGKLAPAGMQQIEPTNGAELARLPFGSRIELEKLFTLPTDGLKKMSEALGGGGGFVVRTAEGHYARLWLRAQPTGAVEVSVAIEDAGVPRLQPPPSEFAVEAEGSARRLRWRADPGRRYVLRRKPFGLASGAVVPPESSFEREVESTAFLDETADPAQGYVYELAPLVDEKRCGLLARALSLPLEHESGKIWRAQVSNGTEIDLYAARIAGANAHVRVQQIYDSGMQLEPGGLAAILDGGAVQQSEGYVEVGEEGFAAQTVFLQLEREAYVRTAEGLLGRVRLMRIGTKGRGVFDAELEIELAPYGADGFLRAPEAPRVEWQGGRVIAQWKRPAAASESELARRGADGALALLALPPDSQRFEEPTPAGALAFDYLVRVVDAHGRRSPWSPPCTVLLVDPSDGPRLEELVASSIRDLLSSDEKLQAEAERRLRVLGRHAFASLQRVAEGEGESAELAKELLREMSQPDAAHDLGSARAHLQLELAALSPALREAALEERRGARLFEALVAGTNGDPHDEEHVQLRSALSRGDLDALVRRSLEAWMSQAEPEWAPAQAFAPPASPSGERVQRYGFDPEEIEARLRSAAGGQRAQVARWIAGWASASAPAEAWALLTWSEIVGGDERAEWPLVRAGLEMLSGRELGSRDGRRAVRLAELHGERARCRAFARIGALFRAPFVFERTIAITPEEGLPRLIDAMQRVEPGTRIVLEPGVYEEDPAHGPIVLRGSHVRIEAREPGSVTIAAAVMIEDSDELTLAGLRLGAGQGFALQAMRSNCAFEDLRLESNGSAMHLAESFVWLHGCRLLGRPNATGIMLRDGAIGIERCLIDGYQTALQAQGRATAYLSRSVFSDLAFAVARGNGEGSSLYVDRCAAIGTARQVFTNFPQGAVARLLLAGVGVPGAALGEAFAVDSGSMIEIEGAGASQWGGAKLQPGVAAWFDAK